MVDEDSSNEDEWAQYGTCTPASDYIEFSETKICDGSFNNCFYLNIDYSYARGCDYFVVNLVSRGGKEQPSVKKESLDTPIMLRD